MRLSSTLNRIPAIVYLWMATAIFAASNSVTRKIVDLGQTHLVHGRNPISLCNVLFVGNICAFGVMGAIFHDDWRSENLRRVTRDRWIALTIFSLLAGALAPAMIFTALDKTTVTNVVLFGRLESPLTLALGIWFLKSRVNHWIVAGAVVAFFGVALTALLSRPSDPVKMMGFSLGTGELLVAGGAILLAIATTIRQRYLTDIPFGIYYGYRTLLGTALFFVIALYLFGAEHFADAFSPFLWRWMIVYAAVIVVTGQLFWFRGLSGSTAAEIALATSANPIVAIVFAFLILGEIPKPSQLAGGSVILLGIILGAIGSIREKRNRSSLAMETMTGYKGI